MSKTRQYRGYALPRDAERVQTTIGQVITERAAWLEQTYGEEQLVGTALRWLFGIAFTYPETSGWFSRPQYRIKNGVRTLITMPYRLTAQALQEILALAQEKNLYVEITTHSDWTEGALCIALTEQC